METENIQPVKSTETIVNKETTTTTKTDGKVVPGESVLFGMSVRALLSLMIVGTVCYLAIRQFEIADPMNTALYLCLGFYLGSATSNKLKGQ